uniref:Uncharacterized protein n=1 Tax=Romanomermis culicivorax TaxID=13658 RepID=A0A915HPX9_ROMCU
MLRLENAIKQLQFLTYTLFNFCSFRRAKSKSKKAAQYSAAQYPAAKYDKPWRSAVRRRLLIEQLPTQKSIRKLLFDLFVTESTKIFSLLITERYILLQYG